MKTLFRVCAAAALALLIGNPVHAASPAARDLPPGLQIPEAARAGSDFDTDKATEAYLNLLSPEQRQQSDTYFEGGYWLQLWGWLYGLGVSAVLLVSGLSRWMRELARRVSKKPWLHTAVYVALWIVACFVLGFPLTVYTDFMREHAFGLATQDFSGWFGDQAKGLGVNVVLGTFALTLLYIGVRRAGARWWIGASIVGFFFILLLTMITPVFISPLFNDFKPLPEGPVREAVLSLARANQIPTQHVDWFDASRQTTRVSANVSGFLGTTRVNLNDNLLNKTSLPEIKAVLGHEMGHYVLNHSLRLTVYFTLVLALGFWCVHRAMDWSLARIGPRYGLEDRADPAALPLAAAILSTFLFLTTPVLNSITRQAEAEADAYGLNAAQEPYGFAMSAMRLSTYRKIKPGPIEEFLFYDHPSGYERVHRSMIWLKEHSDDPALKAELASSH